MTEDRRDRHAGHRRTFRPPDDVYEGAQEKLDEIQTGERGQPWGMNDLLTAALVAFNENPAAMLARLKRSWTPAKKGRPRKGDTVNAIMWAGDNFDDIQALRPDARLNDDGDLLLDHADGSGPVVVGKNYVVYRRESS